MKIINNKKDAIQELKRISTRTNSETNKKINAIVEEILQEVKNYGDIAVGKYTRKFDGFDPDPMQVGKEELEDAWNKIDSNLHPDKSIYNYGKDRVQKGRKMGHINEVL